MKHKVISKEYVELVEDIKNYFEDSKKSIHKARNEIKIIDYQNQSLVVKAFKIPNLFNKIVYTFFRKTKASKSYYNSIRISDFVPRPIGYIEFKKYGLLHDSYFISEKFEYNFTIREVLLDKNFDNRKYIFQQFAEFTYQLHKEGILHKDYSPGNILIKEKDDQYIFKIVDINRMIFKELNLADRLKNFSQLWADNSDLKIIIGYYAALINKDEDFCLEKAITFSQKLKNRKNFKKRLKGKKVVD